VTFFRRLTIHAIWNIGSLIVLGLSGVVLNVVIARVYGAQGLGVFNQVFAVYLLFSQFAAGGLYFSTLKFTSVQNQDKAELAKIIGNALLLGALLAAFVCATVYFLKEGIGDLLQSPQVGQALIWVVPGLWFFTLNKVLLSALNGMERMKIYSIAQGFRYLLIVGVVIVLTVNRAPATVLPYAFSVAEGLLFVGLFSCYFFWLKQPLELKPDQQWIRNHASFAWKAFPGGLLTDLNTRVDVLMLGLFLQDASVGIYSFAAMFVEGFLQIPFAVAVCLSPSLGQMIDQDNREELARVSRRVKQAVWLLMAAVGLIAVLLFPQLTRLFVGRGDFAASWRVFMILMAGVVVSSGYQPFQMILSQAHRPGRYTLYMFSFVLTNVLLNAVLIPYAGIYGAAVATALAMGLSIVYLRRSVFSAIQIRL